MAASGAPLADFTDDELFTWGTYNALDSSTDYELIMAACLFEEAMRVEGAMPYNEEIPLQFQNWLETQPGKIQARIQYLISIMGKIPRDMWTAIRTSALPESSEEKTPAAHILSAYELACDLKSTQSQPEIKANYYTLLTIAVSGGHPDAMRDLLTFFHENYLNNDEIKTKAIAIAYFLKIIDPSYQLQNCCNISSRDLEDFYTLEDAAKDAAFAQAITTNSATPLNFKIFLNEFKSAISLVARVGFNLNYGWGKTINVDGEEKKVSTSAAEIYNLVVEKSVPDELKRGDLESALKKIKDTVKDKRTQSCWNFFSRRDSTTVDLYDTLYKRANKLLGIQHEKLRPTRPR